MSIWYFVFAFLGSLPLFAVATRLTGKWGAYVRLLFLVIAVSSAVAASGLLLVHEPWPRETLNWRGDLGAAARHVWLIWIINLIILAGPQVIGALFCLAGLYLGREGWEEISLLRRGFYDPGGPDEKIRVVTRAVEHETGAVWDAMLAREGRTGTEHLTNAERKQLSTIARRQAVLAGGAVSVLLAIAKVVELYSTGTTREEWWTVPLVGLFGALFFYIWRKDKLLRRAAEYWEGKRAQVLHEEVVRRLRNPG